MRKAYPEYYPSVQPTHQPRSTQQDILDRFEVTNPMVRRFSSLTHSNQDIFTYQKATMVSQMNLNLNCCKTSKRRNGHGVNEPFKNALDKLGVQASDVDMLCCISSTGFMLPGLTAMFIKHLGFRVNCHRMDLVGMGCNAGLNGLNPVTAWATANPGKLAMMVCCEVNSALYVYDDTIGTGVVNSLFGDGCAAILVRSDIQDDAHFAPQVLHFESHLIPDTWRAMSYHWSEEHGKFSFNFGSRCPLCSWCQCTNPCRKSIAPIWIKSPTHRSLDHSFRR